eukprot:m.57791 g.57791  ORF g.57791 m.57791 type:complete len:963 (-) comp13109_c0_seq1:76-2964(-)
MASKLWDNFSLPMQAVAGLPGPYNQHNDFGLPKESPSSMSDLSLADQLLFGRQPAKEALAVIVCERCKRPVHHRFYLQHSSHCTGCVEIRSQPVSRKPALPLSSHLCDDLEDDDSESDRLVRRPLSALDFRSDAKQEGPHATFTLPFNLPPHPQPPPSHLVDDDTSMLSNEGSDPSTQQHPDLPASNGNMFSLLNLLPPARVKTLVTDAPLVMHNEEYQESEAEETLFPGLLLEDDQNGFAASQDGIIMDKHVEEATEIIDMRPPRSELDDCCGVKDVLVDGKRCRNPLDCKIHTDRAKRDVKGRSYPFNLLLQQLYRRQQTVNFREEQRQFYDRATVPACTPTVPIYKQRLRQPVPEPAGIVTFGAKRVGSQGALFGLSKGWRRLRLAIAQQIASYQMHNLQDGSRTKSQHSTDTKANNPNGSADEFALPPVVPAFRIHNDEILDNILTESHVPSHLRAALLAPSDTRGAIVSCPARDRIFIEATTQPAIKRTRLRNKGGLVASSTATQLGTSATAAVVSPEVTSPSTQSQTQDKTEPFNKTATLTSSSSLSAPPATSKPSKGTPTTTKVFKSKTATGARPAAPPTADVAANATATKSKKKKKSLAANTTPKGAKSSLATGGVTHTAATTSLSPANTTTSSLPGTTSNGSSGMTSDHHKSKTPTVSKAKAKGSNAAPSKGTKKKPSSALGKDMASATTAKGKPTASTKQSVEKDKGIHQGARSRDSNAMDATPPLMSKATKSPSSGALSNRAAAKRPAASSNSSRKKAKTSATSAKNSASASTPTPSVSRNSNNKSRSNAPDTTTPNAGSSNNKPSKVKASRKKAGTASQRTSSKPKTKVRSLASSSAPVISPNVRSHSAAMIADDSILPFLEELDASTGSDGAGDFLLDMTGSHPMLEDFNEDDLDFNALLDSALFDSLQSSSGTGPTNNVQGYDKQPELPDSLEAFLGLDLQGFDEAHL